MDVSGKSRKLLIIAAVGLAACGVKLWADFRPDDPIIYQTTEAILAQTDVSEQESLLDINSDSTDSTVTTATTDETISTIPVYICGQVLSPGIYEVPVGTFLYELTALAGGLTSEAAEENINLVFCLKEPVAIYIPSDEDILMTNQNGQMSTSDYIRNPNEIAVWGEEGLTTNGSMSPDGSTDAKININTADQEALETLPGVGESTALAIIQYREKNGAFASVDDIMKVSGIKEGRFDAIREFITV